MRLERISFKRIRGQRDLLGAEGLPTTLIFRASYGASAQSAVFDVLGAQGFAPAVSQSFTAIGDRDLGWCKFWRFIDPLLVLGLVYAASTMPAPMMP